MTHPQADNKHQAGSFASLAQVAALLGALIALGLLAAAPASAAYEQVGCFGGQFPGLKKSCEPNKGEKPSEEIQLGAVSGMAVNPSGAGGVEAGTAYAIASTLLAGPWVVVYKPALDGGLSFAEAWQWSFEELRPTKHCGPSLATPCAPKAGGQPEAFGIAVDQASGNVYALTGSEAHETGTKVVTEYEAGGEEITRFAEFEQGKPTSASPSKVHLSPFVAGIAVDAAGEAYVFDVNEPDNHYHRLMTFEPCTPGDFTSYCYAGQSKDIGAGFQGETKFPTGPAVDAAGHVYTLTEEKYVQEFDLGLSRSTPICVFEFPKGGMESMAVKPDGGVFFFSYKKETGFQTKLVHELAPCQGGAFKEVGKFEVKPERDDIKAMAFDPLRALSGREAGMLYGGAPGGVPGPGTGPGEPGQSSLGYVFAPVEENPPVIESESVGGGAATSAQLHAVINPKNRPTHYAFQYLSDAAFAANPPSERFLGAGEAPLGGAEIKGGSVGVSVGVTVTGLAPGTEYHFRVIASSNCSQTEPKKACPVEGADETFTTFPAIAPGLPDNRAYELVSPAQKNGSQVVPADSQNGSCGRVECKPGLSYTRFPLQASPDGEAIAYEGQPFSPSGGAAIENEYIARRSPGGWQSVNLTPSLIASKGAADNKGYVAFDPGLGQSLLLQGLPSLTAAAPSEYPNFYLQPTAAPSMLQNLLIEAPPNRVEGLGAGSLQLAYAGASANLARVFFGANDALTPEATEGPLGKTNLYEWEGGQLRLVNIGPNGEPLPGATFGSAASLTGAISADGSHAFWTSAAGQLYVRIDGVETRKVEDPGAFLLGSADGSRALLNDGCLYDVEAEECRQLTAGQGGEELGGFKAVLGHSEDLSHLYFVTGPTEGSGDLTTGSATVASAHAAAGTFRVGQAIEGEGIAAGTTIAAVGSGTLQLSAPATVTKANVALTAQGLLTGEEENGEGAKAMVKGFNLYAWDEGSTSFVATLEAKDSASWGAAEASPEGNWFAFLSKAPLTGFDNTGPCETEAGSIERPLVPCREAFLYDAASRGLSCVSCGPNGTSPLGETVLPEIENAPSYQQPRFLIDSGRLYFDTQNSLTPADTNAGAEDVYQFEPNGVGTCANASGCVSLISAGREAGDSNFLAIDPEGNNVFFTTRDRLVPADKDELIDLYDARVNGGIASESEAQPGPCLGEACQPPQPPLAEAQPNSSGPSEGNAKPGKCKKGQVKRNGHCVKKGKGKKDKGKKQKQKGQKNKRGGSR